MDELLLQKTEVLNRKQFTPWLGAGSLRHLSYLSEFSVSWRQSTAFIPSAAPETLIPEQDQSSLGALGNILISYGKST